MDQDPVSESAFDLFFTLWRSSLSLGAFAARCKVTPRTFMLAAAGIVECPPELDRKVREEALYLGVPEHTEMLYVATHGPRGSVRWHHWWVTQDTRETIFEGLEKDDLIVFKTLQHLTVALNPRHVVTAMFGEEDTDCRMDVTAIVPTQSLSDALVRYAHDLDVAREEYERFCQTARELVVDASGFDDDASLGWGDVRSPRAYLVDLKTPFLDSVPHTLANIDLLGDHLWSALQDYEDLFEHNPIAFMEVGEAMAYILLRREQITVLECPTHLVKRAFYASLVSTEIARDMYKDEATFRSEVESAGIFSAADVEQFVAEWRTVAPSAAKKPRRKQPKGVHAER